MEDGTVRMFARTNLGFLAESCSYDGGKTWTPAVSSGITAADTRFYVKKLPSGRVLLIYNADAKVRRNLTLALSEDDGVTWKYQLCLDTRADISYPDADIRGNRIFLTYDRGRCSYREILFADFTEQDIIDGKKIPVSIVSKPEGAPE